MTAKSATAEAADAAVEPAKYALPEGLFTLLDGETRASALEESGLTPEQAIEIYRWMLTVRTMDTRMVNLQRQGRIAFYGPITGQEAASVASGYAVTDKDWVFPALREAVVAFMRGLSLDEWTQEMIQAALLEQRGNKSAAARRLGITRRALDYRLARGEEE